MATLGSLIKKLRSERGMTQEHVASVIGVSRPTYAQIERGEKDITVPQAMTLASLFGVDPDVFFNPRAGTAAPTVTLEKGSAKKKRKEMNIRVKKEDLETFKQVVLYILNKVGGKPNIGETALHKLLYFIDFDYYEKFEETLTGTTYVKNHHGPTAVSFQTIISGMQKEREIAVVKSKYFTYEQKRYLALKKPDLSLLSARDIDHIDEVLARLSDKNATELRQYSHGDIPYLSAGKGEPISYEAVFYRGEPYSVRRYDDEI